MRKNEIEDTPASRRKIERKKEHVWSSEFMIKQKTSSDGYKIIIRQTVVGP